MKISQADKNFAAAATPVTDKKLTKTATGYRDERFEISLEYVKSDKGFKYVIGGELESRFSPNLKEMQKMAILAIEIMKVAEIVEVEIEEIAEEDEEVCTCGCEIDDDGQCIQCGKWY